MLANQAHAVDGGEASRLPFRHQWPAATDAQRSVLVRLQMIGCIQMSTAFMAACVAVLAGCSSMGGHDSSDATPESQPQHKVIIYVSNQTRQIDPVDIMVTGTPVSPSISATKFLTSCVSSE